MRGAGATWFARWGGPTYVKTQYGSFQTPADSSNATFVRIRGSQNPSVCVNMAEIGAKLQALSEEFTKLQQDLQEAVQSRQKLEAQKQENLGVQKQEFAKLKDDETIYKLVGPVLLKQERTDAESTVSGRLEFIDKEISRLEKHIKDLQGKMDKKKTEIIQIQSSAQAAAATAAAPQAAKA
ncbi:hypothetical protein VTJ49DRAFT_6375 [Mycothermus thermophilus]|uniref:Prefoldin subunit 6 n=1 Tax=Humicola insolens TaxID=85995 RepID=A0ABR3VR06_HUMIN